MFRFGHSPKIYGIPKQNLFSANSTVIKLDFRNPEKCLFPVMSSEFDRFIVVAILSLKSDSSAQY